MVNKKKWAEKWTDLTSEKGLMDSESMVDFTIFCYDQKVRPVLTGEVESIYGYFLIYVDNVGKLGNVNRQFHINCNHFDDVKKAMLVNMEMFFTGDSML